MKRLSGSPCLNHIPAVLVILIIVSPDKLEVLCQTFQIHYSKANIILQFIALVIYFLCSMGFDSANFCISTVEF